MLADPISGIVGGALNFLGAKRANEMNRRLAREQMDFQRESMREQMGFQERMSNTSYQRAVADMQAAGINPILAFQQGGASTPSGSTSSGALARVENEAAAAVSSALQSRLVSANVEQVKALTELAKADLPGKKAEAKIWSSKYGTLLKALDIFNPVKQVSNVFFNVKR